MNYPTPKFDNWGPNPIKMITNDDEIEKLKYKTEKSYQEKPLLSVLSDRN